MLNNCLLAKYRNMYGLSQSQMSEILCVSRNSVSCIERGKFLPSVSLAFAICWYFGITLEDLFEVGE